MPEVHDITEYTEEQTTIQGIPVTDTALTPQMRKAVKIHEAIIHHAAEAVTHLYEMGRQLKAMRDGKYYIHLGYESFGQYVEENGDYSFKERQAYKYIKIVETYSDKFVSDNQGLGIERLEMLTALGERDAAELVESTDLAGMTTAEVKQLIKEKQGLGEQLSLLESELDNSEAEYKSEIADAKKAADDLKKKLDAEKEAHDSEIVLLKEQRANAKKVAEDLKKKLDTEKKKLQEQKKAHDSEIVLLKEQLANAKPTDEQIEKIKSEAAAQVKAEYESKIKLAEDKMAVLEKKMQSKNENESRAALKVYFEETQKNVSAFIEKIRSLEDKTERDKYTSGAVKWLEKIVEQLKEEIKPCQK